MTALNWGFIENGGMMESLMHAILIAEDYHTNLFGRPGKDAGQDARSGDGSVIYQSKYGDSLKMAGAINLARKELEKIKKYREANHPNYKDWKDAKEWVLFANFSINPNDRNKWESIVLPEFEKVGLTAKYCDKSRIEEKLAKLPEVRDVFFAQENRVLVGLKEAHDLLSNEREDGTALDVQLVGRDDELNRVRCFVDSPDKRLLPVFGPLGIGKSRFLYESLVALSQAGWRVLWGLPGSMAKSSQWFRLLNGSQKTCVALDDQDDPNLLRCVIEQLVTTERRNWRVIFASPTERSDAYQRYKSHQNMEKPICLTALDEPNSKQLVNSCIGSEAPEPWLHQIYNISQGNPGWLTLIASLAKQSRLQDLPSTTDDIASNYVDSCLERFEGESQNQARTLLRWISLWGSLSVESSSEIQDLETEGITRTKRTDYLKKLVETGLVRSRGAANPVYSVASEIVRQHLLSEWLLKKVDDGDFVVNENGKDIVKKLLTGDLPGMQKSVESLSHLAISRLDPQRSHSFLWPIFNAMTASVAQLQLAGQLHMVELVSSLGKADPEQALDVLIEIRKNLNGAQEINDPFWGKRTIKPDSVVTSLSWALFTLSDYIDDDKIASRFLSEFRHLSNLEKDRSLSLESGKSPLKLVERLLVDPSKFDSFSKPAYKMVSQHLTSEDWWPFVGELAKCLLDPVQQSTEWVANWTIRISRKPIDPNSPHWDRLVHVRDLIFKALRDNHSSKLRQYLWKILSDAHHALHYALGSVNGVVAERYMERLKTDLSTTAEILKNRQDYDEATHARAMWAWYLQFGQESDLKDSASKCEAIYNGLSEWRVHDFFRFDERDRLEPETERVSKKLREATNAADYDEFFTEAEQYLAAARKGKRDMADQWRIGDLANKLVALLPENLSDASSPLGLFVRSVLSSEQSTRPLAYLFAIDVCLIRLRQTKTSSEHAVNAWLDQLLSISPNKAHLLWDLYSNAHPAWTGDLTEYEFQCILKYLNDLEKYNQFCLLGVVLGAGKEDVLSLVQADVHALRDDPVKLSQYVTAFITSAHLTFLRYKANQKPSDSLVGWLFDAIGKYNLDGAILGMYEFESLRDLAGFQPAMCQFTNLMKSRVEMEEMSFSDRRFDIIPHDFKAGEWCKFDDHCEEDKIAFRELCSLALGKSFTALYWMPKYLVQIDPSGSNVAAFVEKYLADNPDLESKQIARLGYLASAYPAESTAWAIIARPICETTETTNVMTRSDREHIFFSLSKKESEIYSTTPGEVPSYFIAAHELAERLYREEPPDSPLKSYRRWARNRAKADRQREQENAKEHVND